MDFSPILLLAIAALGGLFFWRSRKHAEAITAFEGELERAETWGRTVDNARVRTEDEKRVLSTKLQETTADLTVLREAHGALELAKAEVDRACAGLEATRLELEQRVAALTTALEEKEAARRALEEARTELERRALALTALVDEKEVARLVLVETRTELERRLAELAAEKRALEERVRGFQGNWGRQIDTLEAEIETLLRQLGEYRSTTKLPFSGPTESNS